MVGSLEIMVDVLFQLDGDTNKPKNLTQLASGFLMFKKLFEKWKKYQLKILNEVIIINLGGLVYERKRNKRPTK